MRWVGPFWRPLLDALLVRRSGLFDAAYYLAQRPERVGHLEGALLHYLRNGADADPHPLFHTRYYLARNPDVRRSGVNPLVHFLRHGGSEGRRPNPLFDMAFYRSVYPDVGRAAVNPLVHYERHGAAEGRVPHRRFDAGYYAEQCEKAGETLDPRESLLTHYYRRGAALGLAINARQRMRLALEQADRLAGLEEPRPREGPPDAELMPSIRRSRLFDADFYARETGEHFDRLEAALQHFLERGAVEGIQFIDPHALERALRRLDVEDAGRPELRCLGGREARVGDCAGPRRVRLYASSLGNSFFREIANLLVHAFAVEGHDAQVVDERSRPDPAADLEVVVAPHEFFLLGEGPSRLSRAFLRRCWLYAAEQPGTEFFSICLWFARFARGILDINPRSALLWGELGIRARALPLGYVEGFPDYADRAPLRTASVLASQAPEVRRYAGSIEDPWGERPLDVACNAVRTWRRELFFARHASVFSELRSALFLPTPMVPLSAKVASALDTTDATALSQRSKILLNVHRDEMPYFEWHRVVVRGIWQKTLVVTERSLPVPGLEPGVHYIECELDEIPAKIRWLLLSPEGRAEAERVRERAFEALTRHYPLPRIVRSFLAEARVEAPA